LETGSLREKVLHVTFEWALFFKGVFAVAETVTGIGAFLVTNSMLLDAARALTREELIEDPRDLVANYVLSAAQHFSGSTAHFLGLYLISHGAIKLGLILALWRQRLAAYPLAIIVFGSFIVYQLYRFAITRSVGLVVLTAVDALVIALTWHEYRYLRAASPRSQAAPKT
jgi:uncharacterized membrane protein